MASSLPSKQKKPIDIQSLLDHPIAFHRCYAELCGSASGGLFLSQAIYWYRVAKKMGRPEGWFHKSAKEWHEEAFLTRREQEKARDFFQELGILEVTKRVNPAKYWFRINEQILNKKLHELIEKKQKLACSPSAVQNARSDKLECHILQTKNARSDILSIQRLHTENKEQKQDVAQNGQNSYKTKKEIENRKKEDAENNRLADKMKKLNRKVITDEHREIANSLIAINNQFRKGIGLKEEKKPLKTRENWSNVIRLMMEKDGKTREQILDMYEWAKSHTFWSTNINNPTRLRQNFSAMEEQRAAKGRKLKKIKRTAEECPAL